MPHFDHIGDTDSFPNAKFYMQERELSKWVWAMALDKKFRWFMGATDPNDIIRCVDLARQGRLVCIDGDKKDVLPGIDVYAAHDTHTWGSMFVSVKGGGSMPTSGCFSGDLIYSYTNLIGYDPERSVLPADRACRRQPDQHPVLDRRHDESGRRRGETHPADPRREPAEDVPCASPRRARASAKSSSPRVRSRR